MIFVGLVEIYAINPEFYRVYLLSVCSKKFSFASNIKPRGFWDILFFGGILINERLGWSSFLAFLLDMISFVCLVKLGLKTTFYWKAQLLVTVKSLFRIAAFNWMSLSTEKRDLLSAQSLKFEDTPFDESLMQLKNNNTPKIEPWRTPALTFSQDECYLVRKTRCLQQNRKSCKGFLRFPETPFKDSLRINPSCHTLSKAFGITKETPFTSNPSLNGLCISWVIASNWLMQESPGLNPGWLGETNLLSVKKGEQFIINETRKILL